jgi:hypothetical protein
MQQLQSTTKETKGGDFMGDFLEWAVCLALDIYFFLKNICLRLLLRIFEKR